MALTQKKLAEHLKEANIQNQQKRAHAKKQAEKLLQQYKIIDAIIQAKRIDIEELSEFTMYLDGDRFNRMKYELKQLEVTKRKLDIIFKGLKTVQQKIWIKRYINEEQDKCIIIDLAEEHGIHRKRYFALKKEMINHIINAFSLLV